MKYAQQNCKICMKKMLNVQNSLIKYVDKNFKFQKRHFLLLLNCTKRNVKFEKINL